jgi:hypothetical protein
MRAELDQALEVKWSRSGLGAIPLPNNRIDGRRIWAAREGATAEEALPFLGAVHRSFVLRFACSLYGFPPMLHDF